MSEHDNLNRRQFLKVLGVGAGLVTAAYAEAYFGPVAKLARTLDQNLRLPEGNTAQMYKNFQRLYSYYLQDPSNLERKQLVETWLKFFTAREHAMHTDLPITEKLITRFLSANGSELDIQQAFENSLTPTLRRPGEFFIPEDELEKRLFETTANHTILNHGGSLNGFDITTNQLQKLLEQKALTRVSYKGILAGLSKDFSYGFGHATFEFSGEVVDIQRSTSGSWTVGLAAETTTYSLADKYDFKYNGGNTPTDQAAYEFAIGPYQMVVLTFGEAQRLEESAYAKPFEVFISPTKVELPSRITIPSSVF